MLNIQEYVEIKNYSTLKMGGQFRYFLEIENANQLPEVYLFAKDLSAQTGKNVPVFILGGGSNVVFSEGIISVVAIKIKILGFKIIEENEKFVDIKIGAGENWDKVVSKTVEMGLAGIEALSAIPGTVGATPVQNVGAYGSEVKDTVVEVEVFDKNENKIKILSNEECKFRYRDSIFKNEEKGRYVIINVTYRLKKSFPQIPDYPGIKRYFIDNNINNPHLKEIREAIISIRNEKLPNPNDLPNVGSFFKNPILSKESYLSICQVHGEIPKFNVENGMVKIPAGWLIEKAGLKGKSFDKVSIYDKNALVLVNNGEATNEDIIKAKNEIIKTVKDKFGIILEQEPEII